MAQLKENKKRERGRAIVTRSLAVSRVLGTLTVSLPDILSLTSSQYEQT